MANKKFSEFTLKTDSANVDFLVGYDGTDNVRIDPSNIGGGTEFTYPLTARNYLSSFSASTYFYFGFMDGQFKLVSQLNQTHAVVAPYNGYVSLLKIKNTADAAAPTASTVDMGVFKDVGTAQALSLTSLYSTGALSLTTGQRMQATQVLTPTDATFSAGDTLFFGAKINGTFNRTNFTAVLVYQP